MANIGIIKSKLTPVLIYIALNISVKKIIFISELKSKVGNIIIYMILKMDTSFIHSLNIEKVEASLFWKYSTILCGIIFS